jgi:hypothetical protein
VRLDCGDDLRCCLQIQRGLALEPRYAKAFIDEWSILDTSGVPMGVFRGNPVDLKSGHHRGPGTFDALYPGTYNPSSSRRCLGAQFFKRCRARWSLLKRAQGAFWKGWPSERRPHVGA